MLVSCRRLLAKTDVNRIPCSLDRMKRSGDMWGAYDRRGPCDLWPLSVRFACDSVFAGVTNRDKSRSLDSTCWCSSVAEKRVACVVASRQFTESFRHTKQRVGCFCQG